MTRATLRARGLVLLVVAIVLALVASACGDDSDSGSSSSTTAPASAAPLFDRLPARIQDSKELKVGSDIEYPPIEFFKEGTEQVQGVDYDLAQAMGRKLGVKVTFVNDTDFAGIIGALNAGRFDIVMSAMTDSKERQGQGVDFVDYFSAGSGILVAKGNPKGIQTVDDLCGETVAVQKGTVQETDILNPMKDTCSGKGKSLTVLPFEKDSDAVQQVKNGRAVAVLEDYPVAGYNAKIAGDGNDFEVVPNQVGEISPYGIAVPSKDQTLVKAIQAALKAIIADGTYADILRKWGVEKGALTTAPINSGT